MLVDIAIAVGDKLLPEIIKKFIPLVKTQPKKLKFVKSGWTSNFSFFLYNRSKQILFNIYLLIEIGDAKAEDFELSKTETPQNLSITVGDIEVNYEILRLNCIYEDNNEFILLKIEQMAPESFMPFKITANANSDVKFKILKYSKEQNKALHKAQAGAVSFEIPFKKKREIRLKGMSMLMKKND